MAKSGFGTGAFIVVGLVAVGVVIGGADVRASDSEIAAGAQAIYAVGLTPVEPPKSAFLSNTVGAPVTWTGTEGEKCTGEVEYDPEFKVLTLIVSNGAKRVNVTKDSFSGLLAANCFE